MERSLLWSVFAIGWAGWLYAFLSTYESKGAEPRANGSDISKPHLILAALLPVIVFFATLPVRPPVFAAGHGLGDGFLLGGLGALLSGLVVCRRRAFDSESETGRAAGLVIAPFSLTLVVAAIPLLFMRSIVIDALVCAAIGWLSVSLVLCIGCLIARQSHGEEESTSAVSGAGSVDSDSAPIHLAIGTAFATLVCAAAALGVYRGEVDLTDAHTVGWSALAMVFAAGVPLCMLLGTLPNRLFLRLAGIFRLGGPIARAADTLAPSADSRQSLAASARVMFSSVLLLVIGKLLTYRLVDADDNEHLKRKVFEIMVSGVLGGLLVWWLNASRTRHEPDGNGVAIAWQNGALAILVVVSGVMVAFELLAGFGIALMMLGAALVFGYVASIAAAATAPNTAGDAACDTKSIQPGSRYGVTVRILQVAVAGILFVLYRTFNTRFQVDLHGVSLTDHFAVFGLLIGVFTPRLLSGFVLRPIKVGAASGIVRVVSAGLLVLFTPALLLALWDLKCVAALLIGLAIGVALESSETEASFDPSPAARMLPSLFALAMGLAITQWTDHVLPLANLTRAQKERDLLWAAVAVVVVMLIAEISAAMAARKNRAVIAPSRPASSGEGAAR